MRHGIVTEDIVRCSDPMAEVSRGRSTHASGEGPNDRKVSSLSRLVQGIALAIRLWPEFVGRERVKPARDANEVVKP